MSAEGVPVLIDRADVLKALRDTLNVTDNRVTQAFGKPWLDDAASRIMAIQPAPCPPPVAGRVVTGHGLSMRDLVASTIYASLGGGGSLDALIPESRRAYLAAADAVLALLPQVRS